MLKKFFAAVALMACVAIPAEAKPQKTAHTRELVHLYFTQRANDHEMRIPGDDKFPLFVKLLNVARAHDVRVGMLHIDASIDPACPCWGITGFNRAGKALIVIEKDGLTVNEQVFTMAHELAHALATSEIDHPDDDIYAEAVAFIVLRHFGFDASDEVVAYYNGLAGDDEFLILNGLGRMHKEIDATADAIITEMEQ
jgi:hypothetical protein